MIRAVLQNEKPILAMLGLNGLLGAVHKFFITHQPEMTSILTVLQIIVAVMTVTHFTVKYVKALIKKHRA